MERCERRQFNNKIRIILTEFQKENGARKGRGWGVVWGGGKQFPPSEANLIRRKSTVTGGGIHSIDQQVMLFNLCGCILPSCLTLLVWGVLAHFETDTRQSGETVCKHECRRSCRGTFFCLFCCCCKARVLFGDWFPLPLFQFVVPALALNGELSQTGSFFPHVSVVP